MGTVVISTLVGAALGVFATFMFFLISGSSISFKSVLFFCLIGGAIMGFLVGMINAKAEMMRNRTDDVDVERKQRASDVKKIAISVSNACNVNNLNVSSIEFLESKADAQMELILKELAVVSELKERVEFIAEDIRSGGDFK